MRFTATPGLSSGSVAVPTVRGLPHLLADPQCPDSPTHPCTCDEQKHEQKPAAKEPHTLYYVDNPLWLRWAPPPSLGNGGGGGPCTDTRGALWAHGSTGLALHPVSLQGLSSGGGQAMDERHYQTVLDNRTQI